MELVSYALSRELPAIEIESVLSPGTALRRLEIRDYGVLLTDLYMPEMDGLALLDKARIVRPETPVILMSAQLTLRHVTSALRGGAFDMLSKAAGRQELAKIVGNGLEVHRLRRAARSREVALERVRQEVVALETLLQRAKERDTISTLIRGRVLGSRHRTDSSLMSVRRSLQLLGRRAQSLEKALRHAEELVEAAMVEAQFRVLRRLDCAPSIH